MADGEEERRFAGRPCVWGPATRAKVCLCLAPDGELCSGFFPPLGLVTVVARSAPMVLATVGAAGGVLAILCAAVAWRCRSRLRRRCRALSRSSNVTKISQKPTSSSEERSPQPSPVHSKGSAQIGALPLIAGPSAVWVHGSAWGLS